MIQVAICDDESCVVKSLTENFERIAKSMTEYKCHGFTNPEKIFESSKSINFDLLLVDIEMPSMSGFEVARQMKMINPNLLIIFVTNMDLYVYESLKYHPFRFIRKTHLEEMKEAILSAIKFINSSIEKFCIHINSVSEVNVRLVDIVYFESMHNDVKVVTLKQEYIFRSTLKEIEKELSGKGFVRIHSGYIVNVNHVYLIKNTEVEMQIMDRKFYLPISRGHRNMLITEYVSVLR